MNKLRKSALHFFTLVELLIVIAIIAILMSLLGPSLRSAIKNAERIVCINQLRQWGVGIDAEATDHSDLLMGPVNLYGNGTLYPMHMRTEDDTRKEWNHKSINPYVGNPFVSNQEYVGNSILFCPSSTDAWVAFNERYGTVHTELPYSYFGGLGDVKNPHRVPKPDDLCGKRLKPNGVLMADTTYFWSPKRSYDYNHGSYDPSYHYPDLKIGDYWTDLNPIPLIEGMNTLMGDVSCFWKEAGEMEVEKMNGQLMHPTYVRGAGTDQVYYVLR